MYAISFDLVVADTAQNHPKGVSQAYADIGSTLHKYGFDRIQGSLYTCQDENMANLFSAIYRSEKFAVVSTFRPRYSLLPH